MNRFLAHWGKKDSFTFRVFKIFFAFAFALTIGYTLVTVYYQTERVREDLTSRGQTISQLLADSVRIGVFAENRELLSNAVDGFMGQKDVISVAIFTSDGRELLRRNMSYQGSQVEPNKENKTMEFIAPVMLDSSQSSEEALYFTPSPAQTSKSEIGHVKVVLDAGAASRGIQRVIGQNLIIACFLLIVGTLSLMIVLKKVLDPLTRLTEEVKLLGEGREIEKISVASNDEIGRLAGAFNEMTENLKKREAEANALELQFRQAQKMEAVGTLARGIAHDFNNILTTLEASLYGMQKKIDRGNALHSYVYHMSNSVIKAKGLIKSLLIFSKGQAKHLFPVDINSIVSKLKPMLSDIVGEGIECRTDFQAAPIIIMADSVQIEQVLMNLATNARDAMPDGGMLSITTDEVTISEDAAAEVRISRPGKYAFISVADSGKGISEEIRDRIFEPFFTTKDVGKGTGLGLSIVYGIIEQYQGYMFVVSEPERGAEFRIYLPLYEKQDNIVQDTIPEDANG